MRKEGRDQRYYVHQTDAAISQVAVQNDWITVLATQTFVELIGLNIRMNTANETLEAEIVIDGKTLTGTLAAIADTDYYAFLHRLAQTISFTNTEIWQNGGVLLRGKSIRVRVRKTTATGANTLISVAKWARYI